MTPRNYQSIGSYLDVIFIFLLGLLALVIPAKLMGFRGTEAERAKKISIVKICGTVLICAAEGKTLLRFF